MHDSGSPSFVRWNIFDKIKMLGLPHVVDMTNECCHMANDHSCDNMHASIFTVKIQSLSCKVKFFIFEHCPIPCILGVDFLAFAKVRLDFATH
jgi:hypothetical protein